MRLSGHLLKRPPSFELLTDKEVSEGTSAHTDVVTWKMFVQRGEGNWDGCRNTIAHEWGEMLFDNIMTDAEKKRFQKALAADAVLMSKDPLLKNSGWGNADRLTSVASRSIFGRGEAELSVNDRHRIRSLFDIAGSATVGEIGFGHSKTDYEKEFIADRHGNDAFACMYVAVTRGYPEYQEKCPNLWKYMEELLKK